ncbi:hypothetical protein BLOT_014746 [Blomia tropicalis]|nr:hypothetical protein BLOT_014746 [Blomia tropicalis]
MWRIMFVQAPIRMDDQSMITFRSVLETDCVQALKVKYLNEDDDLQLNIDVTFFSCWSFASNQSQCARFGIESSQRSVV